MPPLSNGTYNTAVTFSKYGLNISNPYLLVSLYGFLLALRIFSDYKVYCYSLIFFLLFMFIFIHSYSLKKFNRFLEKRIWKLYPCNIFQKVRPDKIYVFNFYIFANASHFSTNNVCLVNIHVINDSIGFSFPIVISLLFLYFLYCHHWIVPITSLINFILKSFECKSAAHNQNWTRGILETGVKAPEASQWSHQKQKFSHIMLYILLWDFCP